MACNCIEVVDAKLVEHNTRIMLPIMLGADQTARPMIVTDQIETGRGKQKAVGMFATFCPFCGVSYVAAPAVPASAELYEALAALFEASKIHDPDDWEGEPAMCLASEALANARGATNA